MAAAATATAAATAATAATAADVYIGIPCFSCKLSTAFVASLLQLQGACMQRGISVACQLVGNESLITRARNLLVEQFVQSGSKHLLFLDADLAFSPSLVLDRLLPFAETHPDAIVTGCYPKKSYDWSKLDTTNTREPAHSQVVDFNLNPVAGDTPIVDGFVEVMDSATGAMMLPRPVIMRLREAFPELACVNDINPGLHPIRDYVAIFETAIDARSRRYLSEDYAACRRFQKIGGKIYVDLTSGMAHIGTYQYTGDILASIGLLR